MSTKYRVIFKYENAGILEKIPAVTNRIEAELMRVYNIYADMTNNGVTEKLNEQFKLLNPTYFEDNRDKEWYELTEYNQFMADGYNRMIVDKLNEANASPLLEFYVDPDEIAFKGRLKAHPETSIEFFMKEA